MATRRSQAQRLQAARRSVRRPLRSTTLLGWAAAGAVLVALAFVVGRPAAEQGVLGGTPPSQPSPLPIRFGLALDPDTNRAIKLTRRFRSGDRFAYSVTLTSAPRTTDILVEITRIDAGSGTVVQPRSVQHILPKVRTFAFAVRTDDLLAAWGAGNYEMRIFLGDTNVPLAFGRFTLIATPSAG